MQNGDLHLPVERKEYKWKSYTLDQNIENKLNNLAEEGLTVTTMAIASNTVYFVVEKGTDIVKVY